MSWEKQGVDGTQARILVADNEATMRRFADVTLRLEGFDVMLAAGGQEALELSVRERPTLALLEVAMSDLDGYEVCRRLRGDPRTAQCRVIFLTERSLVQDKVAGLAAGADDYVIKPCDPIELVARVRTTLQRSAELRAASPLTGLPGNHRIEMEIARRLEQQRPLAVAYADLTNFKAFNDRYGFLRGDEAILCTAELLWDALAEQANSGERFLGHIGGDDFVLMCHPSDVHAVCEAVVERFDDRIPLLYDPDDRAAGSFVVRNRIGDLERFPLMTIVLGVATTETRPFGDHRELVHVATEMKGFLKQQRSEHSAYAIDARATVTT